MKRKKIFEIIGGISFLLMPVVIIVLKKMTTKMGGSAIGGKIEDNIYFVVNEKGIFQEISMVNWYINISLIVLGIIIFVLGIIAMAYFPIKYFFIPKIKNNIEKPTYLWENDKFKPFK